MSGIRSLVSVCLLSVAALVIPVTVAQSMPVPGPVARVKAEILRIDYYRGYNRGWNGTGYRPYRPYEYRPYRPYRPYAAPYAYRPYNSYNRPYYRPYYRPGVQVYVEPRPYYRPAVDAHVEWCMARYRSYNPQTDTFLTYGGVYKYCRSPYR